MRRSPRVRPGDGDAVCGVLGAEPEGGGQGVGEGGGANTSQADEADAGDGVAVHELWLEGLGEDAANRVGCDAKVHKQPPLDGPPNDGKLHDLPLNRWLCRPLALNGGAP